MEKSFRQQSLDRWSKLDHWQQHWMWNIAIGVAIEIALAGFRQSHFVVSTQNWAMDATLQRLATLQQLHQRLAYSTSALPPFITLIDADEETWRSAEWGSGPYRAPRDKLAPLVTSAISAGAKYVVVDVVIDGPKNSDDEVLFESLRHLQPLLKTGHGAVILVRTLQDPLFEKDQLNPVLPSSSLDFLTSKWPAQFINAAPYFVTDRDGVLRSWRLWRAACVHSSQRDERPGIGHWKVLPSVQLAVKTLIERAPNSPWVEGIASRRCLVSPDALAYPQEVLKRENVATEAAVDDLVLNWLKKNPAVTGQPVEDQKAVMGDKRRFDPRSRIYYSASYPSYSGEIRTLSALRILRSSQPWAAFGSDRHLPARVGDLALIGQSSVAVGDVHSKPLGSMPGALVLANAIDSMRERGIVQAMPEIWQLPITLLSIVVLSLLLALYDSILGTVAIGTMFYAILVVANYVILCGNYWFDFAVPLIGLYVDRLISAFEEHFKLRFMKAKQTISARH